MSNFIFILLQYDGSYIVSRPVHLLRNIHNLRPVTRVESSKSPSLCSGPTFGHRHSRFRTDSSGLPKGLDNG